ncbi:Aminomethyltransferase folate-binding domain-containing protein [Metschnikowia bicuspidata]|uniref:Aminomethyltransferase folate-binding domain-containing protein n=1 Tax=Metschnikowia bicuspidata TaxID=27322 RepID=A0A4V1J2P0_9ASCO|nr:Aminomethyltransferase folate-binding domain-containing protein [Metschnikowia bicuspidata]
MAGIAPIASSFIRIRGLDAAKFLNGLITTRLSPHVTKKKEHTITTVKRTDEHLDSIDITKNWGTMFEDIRSPGLGVHVLRSGVYSMFLNSKGRVVTDCFTFPYPFHGTTTRFAEACEASPEYVVEVGTRDASRLLTMLKMHKLSAKATIEQAPELNSYYYYNDSAEYKAYLREIYLKYFLTKTPNDAWNSANTLAVSEEIFSQTAAESIVGFAIDNRIPVFGLKIVTDSAFDYPSSIFSESFRSRFDTAVVTEAAVRARRFRSGLFETADSPAGTSILPFETNLDFNDGLSLNKGCYVGQELTIRTYNLGVIRKRIVPVVFDQDVSDKLALTGLTEVPIERVTAASETKPRRGKLGKLMSVDGALGFLLVVHEDVLWDNRYVAVVDGQKVGLTARLPDHWQMKA